MSATLEASAVYDSTFFSVLVDLTPEERLRLAATLLHMAAVDPIHVDNRDAIRSASAILRPLVGSD